jgi:uncharacterized integral membrane protein
LRSSCDKLAAKTGVANGSAAMQNISWPAVLIVLSLSLCGMLITWLHNLHIMKHRNPTIGVRKVKAQFSFLLIKCHAS